MQGPYLSGLRQPRRTCISIGKMSRGNFGAGRSNILSESSRATVGCTQTSVGEARLSPVTGKFPSCS